MNDIKKLATSHPTQPKSQLGLTLVELLVALVLGLLLSAITVQSYLSTKTTYRMTEGVSRIQENGRFAVHFLADHIRRAGNLGCVDYVRSKLNNERMINFTSPITGWDYSGTDSSVDTYTLPALQDAPNKDNFVSTQHDGIGTAVSGAMQDAVFNNANPKPIQGSDFIIINSVEETDAVLSTEFSTADTTVTTADNHDFEAMQFIMAGDCYVADLLQVDTAIESNQSRIVAEPTTRGQPRNRSQSFETGVPIWSYGWGPDSKIHKVTSAAYYVGIGASGLPSLFRWDLGRGSVGDDPAELVEGVETLQFLYGEDTSGDGLANRYASARFIDDWQNVVAVRVGMVLRSPEVASDEAQNTALQLLGHMVVTPTDPTDQVMRYAVNTTLKPRNTGVVRSYVVERNTAAVNYQQRTR